MDLSMPPFRRLVRWGLLALAALVVAGAVAVAIVYAGVSSKLPDVQSLRNTSLQEPLYVYARDGRLMIWTANE